MEKGSVPEYINGELQEVVDFDILENTWKVLILMLTAHGTINAGPIEISN